MSDIPSFNSPDLREAYSETKKDIESLRTNLDLISRDIKALEEALDRNGVRIPFRARVEKVPVSSWSKGSLAWGECEASKTWRLLFVETDYDPEWGHQIGETTKPLIEMKAAVRIAAYNYLPNFLRMIAEKVKVEPLQNRVDPEELGFAPGPEKDVDISDQL